MNYEHDQDVYKIEKEERENIETYQTYNTYRNPPIQAQKQQVHQATQDHARPFIPRDLWLKLPKCNCIIIRILRREI